MIDDVLLVSIGFSSNKLRELKYMIYIMKVILAQEMLFTLSEKFANMYALNAKRRQWDVTREKSKQIMGIVVWQKKFSLYV